ncbi:MAG: YtxH domain-containing protein [Anditalea sp.]
MNASKLLLSAIAGVAIGIQIGVLIAPEKGEDTRRKLSKKGDDYLDEINAQINRFIDGVTEKLDKVNKNVSDVGERGKSKVNELDKDVTNRIK